MIIKSVVSGFVACLFLHIIWVAVDGMAKDKLIIGNVLSHIYKIE